MHRDIQYSLLSKLNVNSDILFKIKNECLNNDSKFEVRKYKNYIYKWNIENATYRSKIDSNVVNISWKTSEQNKVKLTYTLVVNNITYCTNNEENGYIYELTEDQDIGKKVGYLKNGKFTFY